MSFYATITGTIQYDQQADFEAVVNLLQDDEWLDQEDFMLDESGARITEERPNVDRAHRIIILPMFHYRNLTRVLANLFVGGTGKVVWTSTDGCFNGGVFIDGIETAYDLDAWNTAVSGEAAPEPETDCDEYDEYVEWQAMVEEAFLDEFAE